MTSAAHAVGLHSPPCLPMTVFAGPCQCASNAAGADFATRPHDDEPDLRATTPNDAVNHAERCAFVAVL